MKIRQLSKLNSINGNKTERNKRLENVQTPRVDRDAANKKWVTDTFVAI